MDWLLALVTLTALEIVLGVDNIVFLTIVTSRLDESEREMGRRLGLAGALLSRILLLLSITWVIGLTAPLFTLVGREFSGRDLILMAGGLFLIGKATHEIHAKLEGDEDMPMRAAPSLRAVVVQVALLDVVFSLDSVITAVGMAQRLWVMITAVVIAMVMMMIWAAAIGRFVEEHPTIKILALSFLILIGVTLLGDGLDFHIPRGYVYFAMGFSVFVEMINLRVARGRRPPRLHLPYAKRTIDP